MPEFAVVCRWQDRRREPYKAGSLAIVVEAANANDAQDQAHAARPDLWADDGVFRETAVHPAHRVPAKEGQHV